MKLAIAALAALAAAGAATVSRAAPLDPAAATKAIDAVTVKNWPELDALYKDIHNHPELGHHELRTAALLAAKMRALGLTVTEHVGGTGVVAILKNGPGPIVMVRTELDALPMEEKTGLPYASRVQFTGEDGRTTFVAHSCGHDNHMAWWVGTAEALIALKSQWSGTVMFIAQPAEETVGGASGMIADGLFTRFPKPDFGFAAHVSNLPVGVVIVKDGGYNSNADAIDIVFKGRGAHGSIPSASIDPIVEAAHFVTDVQTVVSRQKDAGTFGVITVGAFQAGTVGNIIPDHAEVKLTLRSFTPEVRKLLLDGVTRTANAAAAMADAPPPVITSEGSAAAVVNDHDLAVKIEATLAASGGDKPQFLPASAPGISASEDYSEFIIAGVPSLYMTVGGYDAATLADYKAKGEPVPTNHSPFFAPDHSAAIPTGTRTLTLAVLTVAPAK
jgi:hippurate hydrolase